MYKTVLKKKKTIEDIFIFNTLLCFFLSPSFFPKRKRIPLSFQKEKEYLFLSRKKKNTSFFRERKRIPLSFEKEKEYLSLLLYQYKDLKIKI
jgi:hypothetical protein